MVALLIQDGWHGRLHQCPWRGCFDRCTLPTGLGDRDSHGRDQCLAFWICSRRITRALESLIGGNRAPRWASAGRSLGSGLLVQYWPRSAALVFWMFARHICVRLRGQCCHTPTSVAPTPGWLRSMPPGGWCAAGCSKPVRRLGSIPASLSGRWGGWIFHLDPTLALSMLQTDSHICRKFGDRQPWRARGR